jgi:hypothetical protein
MTLADAAIVLNTKPDNLLKRCQRGTIEALKVGNTWLLKLPNPVKQNT